MASLRLNGEERRRLMTEDGVLKMATTFNHPAYDPTTDIVVVRVPERSELVRVHEGDEPSEIVYRNE